MAIFTLDGVCLSLPLGHGVREVLKDVTLSVGEGEIVTVCGASGTGKTSLLRVMGGLAAHSGGSVEFRGRPLAGPPDGVAIVFQDYSSALLQWRTVADNVGLGIERRMDATARRERVAQALRLVGLDRNVGDYPWQLSGGMQQRVQIARALALRPSVLLMDEPFAALDAMTKASLQDELLRLRVETGASIVFITHDIEEAVYLGDRVAVLCNTPGTLAHVFDVALPAPRHQVATRERPEFLALRRRVHSAIGSHP